MINVYYSKDMFIRTLDGHIARITDVREQFYYEDETSLISRLNIDNLYCKDNYYYDYVYSNNLDNASEKLVDLAKVGDFINGEQIEDIIDEFIITKAGAYHKNCLTNDNIESFMTKEKFERNSYTFKKEKKYVKN